MNTSRSLSPNCGCCSGGAVAGVGDVTVGLYECKMQNAECRIDHEVTFCIFHSAFFIQRRITLSRIIRKASCCFASVLLITAIASPRRKRWCNSSAECEEVTMMRRDESPFCRA